MRRLLVTAVVLASGTAQAQQTPPGASVLYQLASPDVGIDWHLHARDGALICALPCDATLGEKSGAWLGVHDPAKSWRMDLPSDLPGPAGSHVSVAAHVGKGDPRLGRLGTVLGVTGALTAFVGLGMFLTSVFNFNVFSCPLLTGDSGCPQWGTVVTLAVAGPILFGGGALLGTGGFALMENNRSAQIRVTPTGVVARF